MSSRGPLLGDLPPTWESYTARSLVREELYLGGYRGERHQAPWMPLGAANKCWQSEGPDPEQASPYEPLRKLNVAKARDFAMHL
jgi:hypothetical protein